MDGRHLRAVPDAVTLEDSLLAAGRGDANAFEAVYKATMAQVYRLAERVVRDPSMAEDVAQEALVEAWRKAPEFDPARGSAKAWILTIAHRRAIDRVRREQRQRDQHETEASFAPEPVAPLADTVVDRDYAARQSARVRAAMATLTDKQRSAVELAFYAGRTHTEISADLAVPLGTAKTRIRDALTALRSALTEVDS